MKDNNQNPNFSYFTQRSNEEFTTSTEFRHHEFEFEFGGGGELERERIRRRVLEEEVRRELMIERELAMRRVPLLNRCESRVGFGIGFETVPFQRDPVLVEIKAKPTVNLTDTKRKATTPPAEKGAVKVSKKQKTNDDWSCTLCGVTASSERALNDHLQGKKHLAKVKGSDSQRTVGFGSEPIPKPVCLPTVKSSKKPRYFCEICRVEVRSQKVFTAHNRGKKHLAKLSKIRKTKDSTEAKDSAQNAVIEETNENDEVEVIAGGEVETDSDVHRLGEKGKASPPLTKEALGSSTWTFLHSLAAQYPERPTRQQKKDVKDLMAILSRMYPCKESDDHFKVVLRSNPVQAGSQAEFSQWLCHVHNVVNHR